MLNALCKQLFIRGLDSVRGGLFHLSCGDDRRFGDPDADLTGSMIVADDRFFRRALASGDIGIGESYMDGDWTSPDLVALIRLMLRNLAHVETSGGLARLATRLLGLLARRLRNNSEQGSRAHIRRHYDLGNDFFRLFLDARHLMYSSGFYQTPADSLEMAQEQKIDRICSKLELAPGDHVLEI